MGGAHRHHESPARPGSELRRGTPLDDARPEVKVLGAFLTVVAIVITPREALWAFGVYLAGLAALATVARLSLRTLASRLVIEVPFLAFAAFLPLLGGGDRTDVGPLSVSVEGSWAAWNILAKATLGVATVAVLGATTAVPDLLVGLRRLRVPVTLVAIAGFMTRYLEILRAELARLQVARIARGDDPRFLWQARAMASTAGALFVRAYERGERVFLAMAARGYRGSLPVYDPAPPATPAQWAAGLGVPLAAFAVAAAALVGAR